jgi:hypothetical protein
LEEFGWTGEIEEFNQAARLSPLSVTDPILITTSGTILSGFGRWQSAVFNGLFEINCIEYPFNEDESLQFILTHHQTRSGWNDFVRICLALALETTLQQNAIENMRAGGKLKGLANCQKLTALMCERRLPAPQALVTVMSATSRRFSKGRTRFS